MFDVSAMFATSWVLLLSNYFVFFGTIAMMRESFE
jgi:hypothetical protein